MEPEIIAVPERKLTLKNLHDELQGEAMTPILRDKVRNLLIEIEQTKLIYRQPNIDLIESRIYLERVRLDIFARLKI